MATETPTFTSNTYAGEAATGYISRAQFEPDGFIEKGLATLRPNVKKKQLLRKFDQEIELIDPSAKFNATGDGYTLSEQAIEPVKYELHREIDHSVLIDSWEAADLAPGSWNDRTPPSDLGQFLLEDTLSKLALANENLYIHGKNALKYKGKGFKFTFTDAYLGLIGRMENLGTVKSTPGTKLEIASVSGKQVTFATPHGLYNGDYVSFTDCPWFTVDNGVAPMATTQTLAGQDFRIKVVSSTVIEIPYTISGTNPGADPEGFVVFINRDNVVETLAEIYMNLPDEIESSRGLRVVVPSHVAKAYKLKQALVATGAGSYTVGDKVLDFIDQNLTVHNIFPANTIAAYDNRNVIFGTDLRSDENIVKVWDMADRTGDEVYRFKAQMKSDIQIAYPDEVLFATPFASML